MKRCAVLGSSEVGQTLSKGLKKHGYEVRIGSRTPAKLGDFSKNTGIPAGTFEENFRLGSTLLVLAVSGSGAMAAWTRRGRLISREAGDGCHQPHQRRSSPRTASSSISPPLPHR